MLSEYLFSSFVAEIRLYLDFICLGMFVYVDDDYRAMELSDSPAAYLSTEKDELLQFSCCIP